MKTDIEIAQSVELKPITEVVEKVGIGFDDLELYGKYKAHNRLSNRHVIIVCVSDSISREFH